MGRNPNITTPLLFIGCLYVLQTGLCIATAEVDPFQQHKKVTQISGRVLSRGCKGEPIAGAAITIDNRTIKVTDEQGYYTFSETDLSNVWGLPSGHHVLVITREGFRSKIVRHTTRSLIERLQKANPKNSSDGIAMINFTMQRILDRECGQVAPRNSIDANDAEAGLVVDEDGDGIDDYIEDWLAQRFAPVLYHSKTERNYPSRVEWLLERTELFRYDNYCHPESSKQEAKKPLRQADLLNRSFSTQCKDEMIVRSDATRSRCKELTYYLSDVSPVDQVGEKNNSRDWVTYVHSYANAQGGISIQYWRFYTYDTGLVTVKGVIGHGGDWECVQVHLDSNLSPMMVGFLGHKDIDRRTKEFCMIDGHLLVQSEPGGHASSPAKQDIEQGMYTKQETWNGGKVGWWDGKLQTYSGGLINVGEKKKPRNGQLFIKYSGLWGSPGSFFFTSGYWGPAFNETGAVCEIDKSTKAYKGGIVCGSEPRDCGRIFLTAWCDDMEGTLLDLNSECYANSQSR